ncbi:hypothetical protein ACHWQZ_G007648 [Mnemiopsis leidyi]
MWKRRTRKRRSSCVLIGSRPCNYFKQRALYISIAASCCGPFLSMFSSCRDSYRSPSKLFQMPKRKLTRSRSLTSSPMKSPRLDKFFRSTKEGRLDLSPKSVTRTRAASSSNKSPDIRKFLSPTSEKPTQRRPALPRRRVNLNSLFEYCEPEEPICTATVAEVSSSEDQQTTSSLKRSQPQADCDEHPAKCFKTDSDTEQLMESSGHVISAVSYKTDLPSPSDPNVPPPPCIKRTWKSAPVRSGYKLFDPNSPRTSSKVQMLCKKLWFSSPTSCEIQTLS